MNEEQKNSYGFSFSLTFYFENIFEKNKLRKKRKKIIMIITSLLEKKNLYQNSKRLFLFYDPLALQITLEI